MLNTSILSMSLHFAIILLLEKVSIATRLSWQNTTLLFDINTKEEFFWFIYMLYMNMLQGYSKSKNQVDL